MRRLILILITAAMPVAAAMSQEATKIIAGKYNEYAVSYLLPQTCVDIEIETEHVVAKAGPYASYTQKYLGIQPLVTEDSDTWELIDAKAVLAGIPDTEVYYNIQLKGGSVPYIYVDKDGILLSINAEPEASAPVDTIEQKSVGQENVGEMDYALSLTEEMLNSGSDMKMAELAAKQIYRLRESRTDLITGDSDQRPDGDALKIMLRQIDEQERRLTAMFTGMVIRTRKTETIRWIPEKECSNLVVARISEKEGVVDKDNLSGRPLYLTMENIVRGEEPLDSKGNPLSLPKNAVIYNIPGRADITLTYGGRETDKQTLNLTQFGIKFGMAPSLFTDKKAPTYLILYPQTGAIRKVGETINAQ